MQRNQNTVKTPQNAFCQRSLITFNIHLKLDNIDPKSEYL
jgi:hypothetical protein